MSEMIELAERCEKATGPDRDLDGLIYRSIDPVIEQCWPHWDRLQREQIVPRYSESIDAAATLLAPGVHVSAQFDMPDEGSDTAASIVLSYGEERLGSGLAATPALALCVAALRAKSAALVKASPLRPPGSADLYGVPRAEE